MNKDILDNLDVLFNLSGRSEMDMAAFDDAFIEHCQELLRLARIGFEQEELRNSRLDGYVGCGET